jgi:phosphatidylglycerophosphatase A
MIGILIAAIVVLYAIIILLGVSVFILFKHVDREKKVKDGWHNVIKGLKV